MGVGADDQVTKSFSGTRFRYTGQTTIPEAQLYYYKARVYDPNYGRFLQTDPIGSKDDLNLYAYVGGDPVNSKDPTGTDAVLSNDRKKITISPVGGAAPTIEVPNAGRWTESVGDSFGGDFHIYEVQSAANLASLKEYGRAISANPTPSTMNDFPSTPGGTRNSAQPGNGLMSLIAPSYVMSVLVKSPDPSRYSNITVNLTDSGYSLGGGVRTSGHPLGRGFVMQFVERMPDGSQVLRSYGEGNGLIQSQRGLGGLIWGGFVDKNLNTPVWKQWGVEINNSVNTGDKK